MAPVDPEPELPLELPLEPLEEPEEPEEAPEAPEAGEAGEEPDELELPEAGEEPEEDEEEEDPLDEPAGVSLKASIPFSREVLIPAESVVARVLTSGGTLDVMAAWRPLAPVNCSWRDW